MKNRAVSILILLALAVVLALPTGPAAAREIKHTHFSGTEGANLCITTPPALPDSRCTPGYPVTLPNGQVITTDSINVIKFQTDDPRFTGEIVVHFTFYPSEQGMLVTGIFRFYPDTISNGYWDGTVVGLISNTGVQSAFYAKGTGTMEGLLLKGTNNNSQIEGEIFGIRKR